MKAATVEGGWNGCRQVTDGRGRRWRPAGVAAVEGLGLGIWGLGVPYPAGFDEDITMLDTPEI
jgi:hypothetical protein